MFRKIVTRIFVTSLLVTTVLMLSLTAVFAQEVFGSAPSAVKADASSSGATTQVTYYVNMPYSEWSWYFWNEAEWQKRISSGEYDPTDPFDPHSAPDSIKSLSAADTYPDYYPGDAIIKHNAVGEFTYMIIFKCSCSHCLALLQSLGSNPAYNTYNYVLVAALDDTIESKTTVQNTLNSKNIKFASQDVFYHGTKTFNNGMDLISSTKYGNKFNTGNTPYIFVFEGNGKSGSGPDLRAIISGPNSTAQGGTELIKIAESIAAEDPNDPLDDEKAVPVPTPVPGDIESQIIGTSDLVTYTKGQALYVDAFKLLDRINEERRKINPSATLYEMDKDVMTAAMQRAAELAIYYRAETVEGNIQHIRPNGKNGTNVITGTQKYVGVPYVVGENMAEGQSSIEGALTAWLTSTAGHREALLDSTGVAKDQNRGYKSVGIGVVADSKNPSTLHYTVLFSDQPAAPKVTSGTNAEKVWTIPVKNEIADRWSISSSLAGNQAQVNTIDGTSKEVSFTSTYEYKSGSTETNNSPFWATYAKSDNESAVQVRVENGKLYYTAVGNGTAHIDVGLAKMAGTADRSLVTLTITVNDPTNPTAAPSATATTLPTGVPTTVPTATTLPTGVPTMVPTATTLPTGVPTMVPTATTLPTDVPTMVPTATFTPQPTAVPTYGPQSALTDEIIGNGDAFAYVSGEALNDQAFALLAQINADRTAAGLSALEMDKDVLEAATQRAAELGLYQNEAHVRPNDTMGTSAIGATSKYAPSVIPQLDELTAFGRNGTTSATVLSELKSASGALTDPAYQSVGIGVVKAADGTVNYALILSDQPAGASAIADKPNLSETWKVAVTQSVMDRGTVASDVPGEALNLDVLVDMGGTARFDFTYDNGLGTLVNTPLPISYAKSSDESVLTVSIYNGNLVYEVKGPGTAVIEYGLQKFGAASDMILGNLPVTVNAPAPAPTPTPSSRNIPYMWAIDNVFEGSCCMPGTGFPTAADVMPEARTQGLTYPATGFELMIPGLDVLEPIVRVEKTNGEFPVEWLNRSVGLLEGSALPGDGISILAAHNHLNRNEVGPFLYLKSMGIGDRLFVRDLAGELIPYVVYDNVKLLSDNFEGLASYLREDALVMITCEDETTNGTYANRRVVFAEQAN